MSDEEIFFWGISAKKAFEHRTHSGLQHLGIAHIEDYKAYKTELERIRIARQMAVLEANDIFANTTPNKSNDLDWRNTRFQANDEIRRTVQGEEIVIKITNHKISNLFNADKTLNHKIFELLCDELNKLNIYIIADPNATDRFGRFQMRSAYERLVMYVNSKTKMAAQELSARATPRPDR
jgi:hypothetical protein